MNDRLPYITTFTEENMGNIIWFGIAYDNLGHQLLSKPMNFQIHPKYIMQFLENYL